MAIVGDKKWRAEQDVRTLKEANEIAKDKKRVKEAKEHVRKEVDAMRKVVGRLGKNYASEMNRTGRVKGKPIC